MSSAGRPKIRSILVTAGPTREKIDPVRFISNYSTGEFGYEIAKAAVGEGLKTVLVSGPTALMPPAGVKFVPVENALEMRSAVLSGMKKADCLVMAAAVSDWRTRREARNKLKRGGRMILELVENPDILKDIGARRGKIIVGFALETENLERNAVKKLKDKKLDMIIANSSGARSPAFGPGRKNVLIIDKSGRKEEFSGMTKRKLAKIILDKILSFNI